MTQPGLPLNDGHVCHVERDDDDNPTSRATPCEHIICRRYIGRYAHKKQREKNDERPIQSVRAAQAPPET